MSSEIKYNKKEARELENLLLRNTDNFISNLDKRFSESSAILAALRIFDTTTLPKSAEPGFKSYSVNYVTVLADHYFTEATDRQTSLSWQASSSTSMTFYSQACQRI